MKMNYRFSRIVRKMGYRSDNRGIMDRYINSCGSWDSHLTNCKNFILDKVSGRNIENLAVYGSGWLLDLPLEELATRIKHIFLYDIVHPPQILHRIRKCRNVSAIMADITGGSLVEAYRLIRSYRKTRQMPRWEDLFRNTFISDIQPDYAVSLNLLSQVGDLTVSYLARHIPFSETDLNCLTARFQQDHIDLLKPGRSCLITDIEEKYYGMDDTLQGSKEVIKCSIPLTNHPESWEWQFDLLGDYVQGQKTISTVIAVEI